MTVEELIEQLEELPPDLDVLLANEEGNSFHFASPDLTVCFADKTGSACNVYTEEYYEGSDEDYPGDNAVVLWP